MSIEPLCPHCGDPMVLRETTIYRYRNGDPRKFYGCRNYPKCYSTCAAHPDGTPASTVADAPTRAARHRAHVAFDQLWQGGLMPRKEAYRWMREALGMTKAQAHIGLFDEAQCERLIAAVLEAGWCERVR